VAGQRNYRVIATHLSRKPRPNSIQTALIGALLITVASLYSWRNGGVLMEAFRADSDAVFTGGEIARLFTSILLHADLKHLLSNLPFFLFFSYLLFGYFGFWVFPVLTLVLGGAGNYLALLTYPAGVSLIGASGVVYQMAGFWLTCYILIERSRSVNRRILHVVGISLILLIPTAASPEVSYRSHLIGFLLGAAAGLAYFFMKRDWLRSREERIPLDEEEPFRAGPEPGAETGPEEDGNRWIM